MNSDKSSKYDSNSFEEDPTEEYEETEREEEIVTYMSEISQISTEKQNSLEVDEEEESSNGIQIEVGVEEQTEESHSVDDHSRDDEDYNVDNIDLEISSTAPSDLGPENHAFHMEFLHQSMTSLPDTEKRFKNGTRKSLSFTNERMREIERHNRILLQKICSKGPGTNSNRPQNPFAKKTVPVPRQASATVNRRRMQRQIDLDNQVLKRKIEAVANRRPKLFS